MKVLYILRKDLDASGKAIIEEQKKTNEVTVVDIRNNKNYAEIIDLIDQNDKVMSW